MCVAQTDTKQAQPSIKKFFMEMPLRIEGDNNGLL